MSTETNNARILLWILSLCVAAELLVGIPLALAAMRNSNPGPQEALDPLAISVDLF